MSYSLRTIAAGFALSAAWLPAQTSIPAGASGFQQFGVVGGRGGAVALPVMRFEGRVRGPLTVLNSPVSATEERKTVQTLGDGTRIEQSDSNLFYRDAQGRTRVDQTWNGKTTIVIVDPVARFVATLDPAAVTATRSAIPAQDNFGGASIAQGKVDMAFSPAGGALRAARGGGPTPAESESYRKLYGTVVAGLRGARGDIAAAQPNPNLTTEDLGAVNQNGVMAQGVRSTILIPAGQIGNDRDIHVVNERWYSADLQMAVKSSNSDPRFGVTTYQLTDIVRSAPDPALFQIPAGFTVQEIETTAPRITVPGAVVRRPIK